MTLTWTHAGRQMTAVPLQVKVTPKWDESLHPRDREGKFIETGARVRKWGGALANVIANVGGGRIEIQYDNGAHEIVHRNYLTVVARPNGEAPTDKADKVEAAPATGIPTRPDARMVDDPPSASNSAEVADNVNAVVTAVGDDPEVNDRLTAASAAYTEALDNGTPGDEADERAELLAALDVALAANPQLVEQIQVARQAATAEPVDLDPGDQEPRDIPSTGGNAVTVTPGDRIEFTADGETLTGETVGFTDNGGPLVRADDGTEYPLLPDASKWSNQGPTDQTTDEAPDADVEAPDTPDNGVHDVVVETISTPNGDRWRWHDRTSGQRSRLYADQDRARSYAHTQAVADAESWDGLPEEDDIEVLPGEDTDDAPAAPGSASDSAPTIPDTVRALIQDGDIVYTHPQGSTIIVRGGRVTKYGPDGRPRSTSATAANLAAGHGRWTRVEGDSTAFDPDADQPGPAPRPTPRPAGRRPLLASEWQQGDPQVERNLREMFHFEHADSGWSTAFPLNEITPGTDQSKIRGKILDRDGNTVGHVVRSVRRRSDGSLEVHHDYLNIDRNHQGQGFADAYYKHLYAQYEANGVDVVTVQANIDVGGYAWAQRGFDWDDDGYDPDAINQMAREIVADNLESFEDRLNPEQQRRLADFLQRLREPEDSTDIPRPIEIANFLSDVQWDHTLRSGRTIKMWPGKAAMLETEWYGIYRVGTRIDRPTPDRPTQPQPEPPQPEGEAEEPVTPQDVIDNLAEQAGNFDGDVVTTLQEYVESGSFLGLNSILRGIDPNTLNDSGFPVSDILGIDEIGEDQIGWAHHVTADIDDVLNETRLSGPATLYRGIPGSVVENLDRGATVTDPGYLSTSADPETARQFARGGLLQLDVPADYPALWVEGVEGLDHMGQAEVLLPRGTTFTVTDVTERDGHRVIRATVSPDPQPGPITLPERGEPTPPDDVGFDPDRYTNILGLDTLETRNSDSLDFHEVGVTDLHEALLQAYRDGHNGQPPDTDEILDEIAAYSLDLPTLQPRNSDSLDFPELAVWQIRDALDVAYNHGNDQREPPTPEPPQPEPDTPPGRRDTLPSRLFIAPGVTESEAYDNLENLFTYTHPESGWYVEIAGLDAGTRDSQIQGIIHDDSGAEVGQVTRSLRLHPGGKVEVHHDWLTIDPEFQGQGFADAYYKHLYEGYERHGVDEVTIQANIDVGGYAWAQRGFEWDDNAQSYGGEHAQLRQDLADNLESFEDRLNADQASRLAEFTDRLRSDDYADIPQPIEIANFLSDVTWTHQLPSGNTIKMWPGKAVMLNTDWHGVYKVGTKVERPTPPSRSDTPDVPPPTPPDRITSVEELGALPLGTWIRYNTVRYERTEQGWMRGDSMRDALGPQGSAIFETAIRENNLTVESRPETPPSLTDMSDDELVAEGVRVADLITRGGLSDAQQIDLHNRMDDISAETRRRLAANPDPVPDTPPEPEPDRYETLRDFLGEFVAHLEGAEAGTTADQGVRSTLQDTLVTEMRQPDLDPDVEARLGELLVATMVRGDAAEMRDRAATILAALPAAPERRTPPEPPEPPTPPDAQVGDSITTLEALEALPIGAQITIRGGGVWNREADGWHSEGGSGSLPGIDSYVFGEYLDRDRTKVSRLTAPEPPDTPPEPEPPDDVPEVPVGNTITTLALLDALPVGAWIGYRNERYQRTGDGWERELSDGSLSGIRIGSASFHASIERGLVRRIEPPARPEPAPEPPDADRLPDADQTRALAIVDALAADIEGLTDPDDEDDPGHDLLNSLADLRSTISSGNREAAIQSAAELRTEMVDIFGADEDGFSPGQIVTRLPDVIDALRGDNPPPQPTPPDQRDTPTRPTGLLIHGDIDEATARQNVIDTFSYTHTNGWTTDFSGVRIQARGLTRRNPRSSVSGVIKDENGREVGQIQRSVALRGDGLIEVHHGLLQINRDQQGQGFADAYYKHLYEGYERHGVDLVTVYANIDVGGYAWAQRGFQWDTNVSGIPYHTLGQVSRQLNAFRDRLNPEQAEALRAFQARLDSGDEATIPQPIEIANFLSDVTWDHELPSGRTITMWPGKSVLLGTDWHGVYKVGSDIRRPDRPTQPEEPTPPVDLTPPADLTLPNLAAEIAYLSSRMRRDPDFATAERRSRHNLLAQEQDRRIRARAEELFPDGATITEADLRRDDRVILPTLPVDGRIEPVTVTQINTNGDQTTVHGRYDDGTERVFVIPVGSGGIRRGNLGSEDVTTETVTYGDLEAGDVIIVQDEMVRVVAVEDTRIRLANANGVTWPQAITSSQEVRRVTGPGIPDTPPQPEPPRPVGDLSDAELDAESTRLRDEWESNGFNLALASRQVEISARLDEIAEEQMRRRDRQPMPVKPVDGPTTRPVLNQQQRQDINALNLDVSTSWADGTLSAADRYMVMQAAARIRATKPLTAEQASALAAHLRTMADGYANARNSRRERRLAAVVEAATFELTGATPPPVGETVEKVRPAALTPGDTIVVTTPGGPQVLKVTDSTGIAYGRVRDRVFRLNVTDQDGVDREVYLTSGTDTYRIPTLTTPDEPTPPEPTPDNPPDTPTREVIIANDLRVGDKIVMGGGADDQPVVTVTRIEETQGGPLRFYTDHPGRARTLLRAPADRMVRYGRGDNSLDQPYLSTLPADNPEQTTADNIQVGDRVDGGEFVGDGTITTREAITGEDGTPGWQMTHLDDAGIATDLTMFAGSPITRLSTANTDIETHIRRMQDAIADARTNNSATTFLTDTQTNFVNNTLDTASLGVGHSKAEVVRLINGVTLGPSAVSISHLTQRLNLDPSDDQIRDSIRNLMTELRRDTRDRLVASVEASTPLQGETEQAAVKRVLDEWRASPPLRRLDSVARTFASAMQQLGGPTTDDHTATDDIDPDAPLADRITQLRGALGDPAHFGQVQARRATYTNLDVAALERGEVPEVTYVTTGRTDTAADGGPGETAMRHLAILKTAGREVDARLQEVQARIMAEREQQARDEGVLQPNQDIAAGVMYYTTAASRARRDATNLHGEARRIRNSMIDRISNDHGYPTGNRGIDSAIAAAREFAADTDPDSNEQQALDALVSEQRDIHREAENDPRYKEALAKATRKTELADKHQERADRFKRFTADAQREAAIEVIGSLRGIGGERLNYYGWDPNRGVRQGRARLSEDEEIVQAMRQAEAVLPSDWVASIRNHLQTNSRIRRNYMGLYETERGGAGFNGSIGLSTDDTFVTGGNDYTDVAVHELGHFVERAVPGMMAAERAFLWSRTSHGEIGNRTRTRLATPRGGDSSQQFFDNHWRHQYSGVDYMHPGAGHRPVESFELLTTGVEDLFGGNNRYLDDDFRQWLLGTLAIMGDPKPPAGTRPARRRGSTPRRRTPATPPPPPPPVRKVHLDGDYTPTQYGDQITDENKKALSEIFEFKHDDSGFRVEAAWDRSSVGTGVTTFRGNIVNADGERIGNVTRTVTRHNSRRIEVHHDLFQLNPDVQGQGFADAYYKHLYAEYPSFSATEVTIQANIDVGGYAWAQRGFEWKSAFEAQRTLSRAIPKLIRLSRDSRFTPAQKAEIRAMIDTLQAAERGTGPMPSPKEIANMLSSVQWTHTTDAGVQIKMWPGKWMMLGTNWHGIYKIPRPRRRRR